MLEEMRAVLAFLAKVLAGVDLSLLDDEAAAEWLAAAGEIERLGACLRLLVAGRAVQGPAWSEQGHRSPASWVAEVAGTSVAEARSIVTTSERLAGLEATRAALASGELSPVQATVIARAATADGDREQDLLDAAGDGNAAALHRLARQVEATAESSATEPAEAGTVGAEAGTVGAEAGVQRFLRMWGTPYGSLRFVGELGEEDGAVLMSSVRSRAVFVADEAAAAGLAPEPQSAYDADALVALVTGDRRQATFSGNVGAGPQTAEVVLHVNLEDLRSGTVAGASVAIDDMPGVTGGCLEALIGDAVARLEVEDGGGVVSEIELGPIVPEGVRQALDERDRCCVVPGCAVTLGLRTEFWQVPFGRGGPAELWNLAKLCRFHHRLRSAEGYLLGGGPGGWEWRAPP